MNLGDFWRSTEGRGTFVWLLSSNIPQELSTEAFQAIQIFWSRTQKDSVGVGRDLFGKEGLSEKLLSLQAESSKLTTAGTSLDESKSGFRVRPSPRRTRGAPPSQAPAASPRPATLSTRQRQGTLGRDECRTSKAGGTPQSKQKSGTSKTLISLTMLNNVNAVFFAVQLSWAYDNIAGVIRKV